MGWQLPLVRKEKAVRKFLIWVGVIVVGGVLIMATVGEKLILMGADAFNAFRSRGAPAGTLAVEVADASAIPVVVRDPVAKGADTTGDWPSFNKTLTSERFSALNQINAGNVRGLKVQCVYDTGQHTSFQSGLLMVNGALIGTTEHDIFSLDPDNCHENWRTHEEYNGYPAAVNRGAGYLDGALFRGTEDGRVLAYDFATGKRIWETHIADLMRGESVPSAPIAWNGLVFIGTAGGDNKGVKGRMYALDAKTGHIVWEFYLVPKEPGDKERGPQGASPLDKSTWANGPHTPISGGGTWTSYTLDPEKGWLYVPGGNPAPDFVVSVRGGENLYTGSVIVLDAKSGAYINHIKVVAKDWHDWDVSGAPSLFTTRGGRRLVSVAPKDGNLYGFDMDTYERLYRTPVTKIENADVPFSTEHDVHFCPGAVGGTEWNGPAFDPRTNLVMVGSVEWCGSAKLMGDEELEAVPSGIGVPWFGATANSKVSGPYGKPGVRTWAGWLYGVDADSGEWRWRAKTNYPVVSGVTPTAGNVVFFGDVGGNFYALDSTSGKKLWGQKIGGAIGGGPITYTAGAGVQRVAVATGFTSIFWPVEQTTAKVVILGL